MTKILKDMPLEGKVIGIKEDTIHGGFGRLDLRHQLIIENEFLGIEQHVAFIRPGGEPGSILSGLLDDFKADKEIKVKGRVSYNSLDSLMFGGRDKDRKELLKKVKRLAEIINWKQITQDEKELLADFLGIIIIPYGEVYLDVLVDDKAKYVIRASADDFGSADLYFYSQKEVESEVSP